MSKRVDWDNYEAMWPKRYTTESLREALEEGRKREQWRPEYNREPAPGEFAKSYQQQPAPVSDPCPACGCQLSKVHVHHFKCSECGWSSREESRQAELRRRRDGAVPMQGEW